MTEFYNQSLFKGRRQAARANMPPAEVIVWSALKGRKMCGCKFRRQFGIGPYRLDFYCVELRLAIELDGDTHFVGDAPLKDRQRQEYVEQFRIRVVRILNDDVYDNLDGVWDAIDRAVRERKDELQIELPPGRKSKREAR